MSLHKLSAGDGYTYLTRQVAAADDVALNGDEPGQVLRDDAMLVPRDHARDLAAVLAARLEFRGQRPDRPTR